MLHVASFSQSGIRRPQRANAVFKAEVPADLTDSAACHGVVDILDPIPYALNQFSDAFPVAAAKPCRSCGGYKIHHPWCPTLGLNVRTAFHGENPSHGAKPCAAQEICPHERAC